jgi:hypothetical protein
LREKQKLKLHSFMIFWATIGCTVDLSEGDRKDMGYMERYRNITKVNRDIMGNKEKHWAMVRSFRVILG